jgi:hypothetical protein
MVNKPPCPKTTDSPPKLNDYLSETINQIDFFFFHRSLFFSNKDSNFNIFQGDVFPDLEHPQQYQCHAHYNLIAGVFNSQHFPLSMQC